MQTGTHHRIDVARAVVIACACYAIAATASALLGWAFNLPRLTDWTDQQISMFPNAAICGMLLAIALLLRVTRGNKSAIIVARILAGLTVGICTITLIQHASGWNSGIDTLFFARTWGQTAAASPMRMGVPASVSYWVLGLATILAGRDSRGRRIATGLALFAAAVVSLSLAGYWFGASELYVIARFTGIAFLTSTVVAALAVALIASIPEFGLTAALRRNDAGGAILRRLIVPVLIIPLVLGYVRILGQNAGLYDVAFGTAMRTLAEIALFVVLIWWTANNISWHASSAQKAQARLAAIVEFSDDVIISISLEGIIESWNSAAERTFGFSSEEAIGQSVALFVPPERMEEEQQMLDRLKRGEPIALHETVRVRNDGHRIAIALTMSPIKDNQGRIVGASKIARDITERRKTEERLRAIVEATPECVKIVAPDGSLEFMNSAGLCMIESESESSVIGGCTFDLIVPEHRAEWIARHQRICAGEKLNWEFEIVGLRGTRRWMETHAVPLPLPDGRTAHLAVTREITSRKQLEQERECLLQSEREARTEAERASQLKDDFLATLSHELRTPLNAILGWSQLLGLSSNPADMAKGLEAIQRNARAQAQLIEDLLDMSRIISGKVRLSVQATDLAPVIQAAIDSTSLAAEAKQVRVRKVLDAHAGAVWGDPTRLQQIVWNLLANAIKFTPKGGAVDVVLQRVGSSLEITVRDSGIGISAANLPIIFERFRQVDSSTTRSHGGLGLGLSIVKQLVELHGGSISVHSAGEGQGATFSVLLPLSPIRESAPRKGPSAGLVSFDGSRVDLSGIKVLVVDDEPDARMLILRVLTQCGAEVRTVESAQQGLLQIATFLPHVVISDIGMPEMDGYQFIRQVRSLGVSSGGRTPAIALTAFARSEDRTKAMLAGFQLHVAKPIEPQELAATVHSLSRNGERGPMPTDRQAAT